MTRLIDADAIEYEVIMEPMGNGMYSHANHVYEGVIDAMPTVDAIPVEWIKRWSKEPMTEKDMKMAEQCEWCHRKYMNWQVSDAVIEKACEIVERENDDNR